MNELQVFKNNEFGEIRTLEINGKPYFVANDIAKALGYANPSKATNDHCKHSIIEWGNDSLGRRQQFKFVPEGDLYRLISHSKLPSAEKFESWIFDDVIPSIRKYGMYATDELLDNPDLIIKMATKLKEERELNKRLQEENEEKTMKTNSVFLMKTKPKFGLFLFILIVFVFIIYYSFQISNLLISLDSYDRISLENNFGTNIFERGPKINELFLYYLKSTN